MIPSGCSILVNHDYVANEKGVLSLNAGEVRPSPAPATPRERCSSLSSIPDPLSAALSPLPYPLTALSSLLAPDSLLRYPLTKSVPAASWPQQSLSAALLQCGVPLLFLAGTRGVLRRQHRREDSELRALLEGEGWRMESGGWRVEDGGWRVEGGGWRVEGGGWRLEGGGWRVEGGGWRVEGVVYRV